MGILKILITALIFVLPLGVLIRISPAPNVYIYPHDILVSIVAIVTLFKIFKNWSIVAQKKLFVMAGIFILIGFLSLLYNSVNLNLGEFYASISYLARFAAYVLLLFSLNFVDDKFRKTVIKKLLFAGYIFAVFGFVQYFLYNNLRNLYYLGWDEHLYRLFSTFLDPNYAGVFLVFTILISFSFAYPLLNKRNRAFYLYSIATIILLIAFYLTYSRSALIMLIVGLVVLLSLMKKFKLLILGIVVVTVFYIAFSNGKIEGLNPLRIASVEARLASSREAISIIEKNFLIGVGFNSYRYAQINEGFRNDKTTILSNADAGTDNSYLFVFATTGIVGFLIYIDFWTNILKSLVNYFSKKDLIPVVTFASVVALLVDTIFINSIFYTPILAFILLLVGATVSKKL